MIYLFHVSLPLRVGFALSSLVSPARARRRDIDTYCAGGSALVALKRLNFSTSDRYIFTLRFSFVIEVSIYPDYIELSIVYLLDMNKVPNPASRLKSTGYLPEDIQ